MARDATGRARTAGADRKAVGPGPLRDEAGQSGQQAQAHDHRCGLGPGGSIGGGDAGRAGLQRQVFLLSGLPAPRALASPRRAASTPRRITSNDGDSIYRLFYDTVKGGDFRVARSQRLPAGADQRQHHRPVRGAGRAVRARIRRHCWPTARSAARRFRARFTRAGRRASSCCWARIRRWSGRSPRAA